MTVTSSKDFFPKIDYQKPFDRTTLNATQPVFIVGMHNSGTSILSELLHESGVFMGNSMGHFESHFFSIFINNELLLGGGKNWAKLPLNSEKELLTKWPLFKNLVNNWYVDYMQWGYNGTSKWGIKDPRLCITLPLYLRIFPNAKVIYLERDIDDVAASLCIRKKANVGIKNDFGFWKELASAYSKSFTSYKHRVKHLYKLSYENFCNHPLQESEELFKFLNISAHCINQTVIKKISPKQIGSYERIMNRMVTVSLTKKQKDQNFL